MFVYHSFDLYDYMPAQQLRNQLSQNKRITFLFEKTLKCVIKTQDERVE